MIGVIICDPDLFAREGVKQMLMKHKDLHIAGEARDAFETIECLHTCSAEVCLLEIAMAGHCGLKLVRELSSLGVGTPILVMSHRTERDFALRTIRSGASGFISKDCSDQQLASAIRTAAQRRPYISEVVSELIVESIVDESAAPAHQKLSDLDFEILCLLANGMQVSAVAKICGTSVAGVRARKTSILEKLGLSTDVDLVHYALTNHLIEHPGFVS